MTMLDYAGDYKIEVEGKYNAAIERLLPCPCGETPEIIYPIFTTQFCTTVKCACGKRVFGEPEDPVSAVDNWNTQTKGRKDEHQENSEGVPS